MVKITLLCIVFCFLMMSNACAESFDGLSGIAESVGEAGAWISGGWESVQSAWNDWQESGTSQPAADPLIVFEPSLSPTVSVVEDTATVELNGVVSEIPINRTAGEPYPFVDADQRVWNIDPDNSAQPVSYCCTLVDVPVAANAGALASSLSSKSADAISASAGPDNSVVVSLEKNGVRGSVTLDAGRTAPLLVTDDQKRTWKFNAADKSIELTDIQYIGSEDELLNSKPETGKEYQLYRVGNSDIYSIVFQEKAAMQEAMFTDGKAVTTNNIRFVFDIASHEGSLSAEQNEFRNYLVDNGIINLINGSYIVSPDQRVELMALPVQDAEMFDFGPLSGEIEYATKIRHELNHVFYNIDSEYQNAINSEYNTLTQDEKNGIREFLSPLLTEDELNDDALLIAEYAGYFGLADVQMKEIVKGLGGMEPGSGDPKLDRRVALVKDGTVDDDFITEHSSLLRNIFNERLEKLFAR